MERGYDYDLLFFFSSLSIFILFIIYFIYYLFYFYLFYFIFIYLFCIYIIGTYLYVQLDTVACGCTMSLRIPVINSSMSGRGRG